MAAHGDHPVQRQADLLGWNLRRVAAEAALGYRTVTYIVERRRIPTEVQLKKLADALGVSVSDLADPTPPTYQVPTNPQRRPWGASNQPIIDATARFNEARARHAAEQESKARHPVNQDRGSGDWGNAT